MTANAKVPLLSYFRTPALTDFQIKALLQKIREQVTADVVGLKTEWRFLVDSSKVLNTQEQEILQDILAETYQPEGFGEQSIIGDDGVFQVGPKLAMTSSWSTNMVAVCQAVGLISINRVEKIRRYLPRLSVGTTLSSEQKVRIEEMIHDFMVEQVYPEILTSFGLDAKPEPTKIYPVLKYGIRALRRANRELGTNMSEFQLQHILSLCRIYRQNPTDVFVNQCGQGISEHSRHGYFNALQEIDGMLMPQTLMEKIKSTVFGNERNSISHFSDNSSVIRGFDTRALVPISPLGPSAFRPMYVRYEITFNAETHNYPTAVKSFPGAATGTGGRVRDNIATGRGGLIIAGTTAYMVGHLFIPGYELPWEIPLITPPQGIELPREIIIGASNGASDYGNKLGEPVIQGSARSFEMVVLRDGQPEIYGYRKCIMFTGGLGQMRTEHVVKGIPEGGMLVVRFGGRSRPVGIGGGARSSDFQKLDRKAKKFDASGIQRDDAEMENLGVKVVRTCVELGPNNPIVVIHDSGAGGLSNVGPEISFPAGGHFFLNKVPSDDSTMSQLAFWTNECQEVNLVLVWPEKLQIFIDACSRETCPVQVIGFITGDGKFTLFDERDGSKPVDFIMEDLLGKGLPQETKKLASVELKGAPMRLPRDLTLRQALERVLRLLDVGSKRFLTTKVDRSVTGQIAQQQTVGPCQITAADFAIVANSVLEKTGAAISMGEQPVYGLIDPEAMVRMSIAEALLNLAGAKITSFDDIYFSGNWMWAVKIPGEGVRLFNAVDAVTKFLSKIGLGINAGKDSLSMALEALIKKILKMITAPGTFVASAYTTTDDITCKVTPDLKLPGRSEIAYLDLGKGKTRLGGSVLGRVYNLLGSQAPDIKDHKLLKNAFNFIQELVAKDLIIAYHDRSDGGLVVTLLEMAYAGNCGFDLRLKAKDSKELTAIKLLLNQEAGCAFEYRPADLHRIRRIARRYNLRQYLHRLGRTSRSKQVEIAVNGRTVLIEDMRILRNIWEETSFKLDELQANPETVAEERRNIFDRPGMHFHLGFRPRSTPNYILEAIDKPLVAIFRAPGSNGDREMADAWWQAGFEPVDLNPDDLLKGKITLDIFQAVAFVGGFSFSDVPDAGKGWASVILHNPKLKQEFERFFQRPDTIGLYVCNGCQVAPLIGVVPWASIPKKEKPRFIWGRSGRFESRFAAVTILPSKSIFLQGMEGSVLGIWVANGEGRLHFPNQAMQEAVLKQRLSPIRYVDDNGNITEEYPFNMSGGPLGMCSLISTDGRHLALMPHPERSVHLWQWAYTPWGWRLRRVSPWLMMFQNAYRWCMAHRNQTQQKIILADAA